MSDGKPEANEGQAKGAEPKAAGPTRRHVLKAAAAATPIIMSIKARPAFADHRDRDYDSKDEKKDSGAMSHNMSTKPSKKS
ncbi:MAG TPA: hypothetical protein VJU81_22170 [Methylomirabilota bacterium]|nr:hypothetical protein [Methylomirabilota bacterium]